MEKINKTLFKQKNQLLGVDRIKILIPCYLLKPNYEKYFDLNHPFTPSSDEDVSESKSDIQSKKYKLSFSFSDHVRISIIKYYLGKVPDAYTTSDDDENGKYLFLDLNIPKFIYSNNICESTFSDLMTVIKHLSALLSDIVDEYDLYRNSIISYLEVGRNDIRIFSSQDCINYLHNNTRSYAKKDIDKKHYPNGGLQCTFANTHKILSYYDKNLELEAHAPTNNILTLLKKENLQTMRMEAKFSKSQEVKQLAKKYLNKDFISLHDLLFTDITSKILLGEWLKQLKHMNIFDLHNTDIKTIISHVKKSKSSKKMKKALCTVIKKLNKGSSFDGIYNQLKKNLLKEFP